MTLSAVFCIGNTGDLGFDQRDLTDQTVPDLECENEKKTNNTALKLSRADLLTESCPGGCLWWWWQYRHHDRSRLFGKIANCREEIKINVAIEMQRPKLTCILCLRFPLYHQSLHSVVRSTQPGHVSISQVKEADTRQSSAWNNNLVKIHNWWKLRCYFDSKERSQSLDMYDFVHMKHSHIGHSMKICR